MKRLNFLVCLLLLSAVRAHPDGDWKWSSDSSTTAATPSNTFQSHNSADSLNLSVADESGKLPSSQHADHNGESSSSVNVEEAADAILHSTRTGKVINTYEAVYEDPSVQQALEKGNDTEARTYIKQKLCNLGLAKECAKLYAKSNYGFGAGGFGIDPNAVSYVQPVAIVPAGAPIAAVPLGIGGGGAYKHKGHHKGKGSYGPPPLLPSAGYGAPPIGGLNTYGAPPIGGLNTYGAPSLGGLNSLAPPPIPPVALPPAPVQHLHHHIYEGGVGYKKGAVGYSSGSVQSVV